MEQKNIKSKWQKIEDVPVLILDWATLIAGKSVSIIDVNELVDTFEDWLNSITLDDTAPHAATNEQ
jgi:hypothetical protein